MRTKSAAALLTGAVGADWAEQAAVELLVIEDPTELRRGLDRFLELHLMRARLKSAVDHPNLLPRRH